MIVVTGAAGFIGSNLVAALEARGETDIVAVDWLGRDDKWRNLAKRGLAGLIPPEQLGELVAARHAEIRMIYHLGAISTTTERDVDLILDRNFRYTRDLWEQAVRYRLRLVYASSAATYGDGSNGFDDDMTPAALARLVPLNPYAWSKHLFDRKVAAALESDQPMPAQWAGLKFFNVFGPNEAHKGAQMSVVPQFYKQITAGDGAARLFKSYRDDVVHGGQQRDFVHVDDTVAVMLWLLDSPVVNGVFNVGSGAARSFLDMANAVFAALNLPPRIEFVEMPEALRDRYQYFTQAPVDRLRQAGFDKPLTPLEQGVDDYVNTYLAAPDPYR